MSSKMQEDNEVDIKPIAKSEQHFNKWEKIILFMQMLIEKGLFK
jgi:hypothetical protein